MVQLRYLLLVGAATTLGGAANCGAQDLETVLNGQMFSPVILYGARQSMCEGSISCNSKKSSTCLKYFRLDPNYDVTVNATATGLSYTHCFDALQNLIDTCYGLGYSNSNWALDDQTYNIKVANNPIEEQFVPDVPNPAQVPLPVLSYLDVPDLLTPAPSSTPTLSSTASPAPSSPTSSSASCPSVPPCPAGKSCPNPVPCDQLSCSKDCCGTIPNPQWCNQNCGGMSC